MYVLQFSRKAAFKRQVGKWLDVLKTDMGSTGLVRRIQHDTSGEAHDIDRGEV